MSEPVVLCEEPYGPNRLTCTEGAGHDGDHGQPRREAPRTVIPVEEVGALRTWTVALAAEHNRLYAELLRLGALADRRYAALTDALARAERAEATLARHDPLTVEDLRRRTDVRAGPGE